MDKPKNIKKILALFTSLLSFFVSTFSLINPDIYSERINRITRYELMGQDLATVIISIIFFFIIVLRKYSNIKTRIIWLGFLLYLFYIYAYFCFGGINSPFYLIYIIITGISFFLFIFIIMEIIKNNQYPNPSITYPGKSISIFLILSIFLVSIIEIIELLDITIINHKIINPYYSFYILDLCIIFPMIIIAAMLNLKRTKAGYLLSGIALLKIITILPGAVLFNDIFHKIFVGYFLDLRFDIIALFITFFGAVFMLMFMKKVE